MPVTSESLYEQLFPLSTVMKQRVVENFSGDALDTDRWTTNNHNGTNTFTMDDSTDGGFKITTAGADGNAGSINFNNKRQYSPTGSTILSSVKLSSTSTLNAQAGLVNVVGNVTTSQVATFRTSSSYFALFTAGGSFSATDSSISKDTNYHTHKIECGSSDVKYTIDGSLEITKTTNRPTVKLQPYFFTRADTASAKTGHINYLEAYNT